MALGILQRYIGSFTEAVTELWVETLRKLNLIFDKKHFTISGQKLDYNPTKLQVSHGRQLAGYFLVYYAVKETI